MDFDSLMEKVTYILDESVLTKEEEYIKLQEYKSDVKEMRKVCLEDKVILFISLFLYKYGPCRIADIELRNDLSSYLDSDYKEVQYQVSLLKFCAKYITMCRKEKCIKSLKMFELLLMTLKAMEQNRFNCRVQNIMKIEKICSGIGYIPSYEYKLFDDEDKEEITWIVKELKKGIKDGISNYTYSSS